MSIKQIIYQIPNLSKVLFTIAEHNNYSDDKPVSGFYSSHCLNSYGDLFCHWDTFSPTKSIGIEKLPDKEIDIEAINFLVNFCAEFNVVLLPPAYQNSSFINNNDKIEKIHHYLKINKIEYATTPESLSYQDSLFLDNQYHLNGYGVNKFTTQVIEILDKVISAY